MNSASDKSPWLRFAVVTLWAIAFAFVEAMVVYYLRKLFGLRAFSRAWRSEHDQVERHYARRPRMRVFFMKPS